MGQITWQIAHTVGSLALSAIPGVGPIIGAAAYATGELAAQFLIWPQRGPDQIGPRAPLQTPAGTLGQFRPIGWGRCRVQGTLIWQLGNQLQEHITKQGSGVKGGTGTTTFSYSTSAAWAFAEGPAWSVTRIWGDGKLFYSWDGVNPSSVLEKYPGVVRVYLGTEDQLPDPLIQAGRATITGYAMVAGGSGYAVNDTGGVGGGNNDLGYKVLSVGGGGAIGTLQLYGGTGYAIGPTYPLHRGGSQEGHGQNASLRITTIASGATQVPAWRDTCYIVFDALPLADFGNHLPSITAEVNFTNGPVAVSTILRDICLRAGLTDAQVDVSRVTPMVEGYVLFTRPSARAALQPLLDVYLIDCIESDDRLVFMPRGQASRMIVPEACLGAHDPGQPVPPALSLTHVQEVDLPERLELQFLDRDRDYDWNMQYAGRVRDPIPTQWSRQKRQVQAPLVLSPDVAKQQAQKMLYSAWVGRDQGQFTSSRALARLDATDVIDIQQFTGVPSPAGSMHTLRLTQTDFGAQGLLRWQGVSEQAAVFTISTPAVVVPWVPDFIALPGPTQLIAMDTSILSAEDNDTGLYLAVASSDVGWRGATVWRSVDGVSGWEAIASFQQRARYGTAATVLPLWLPYNTWDRVSTVQVTMQQGTPDSYTADAILAGQAHPYLIGQEIVYAQQATQLSASVWQLSLFLRARRGTDWAMGGHTTGESVVILEPDTVQRYHAPVSDLHQTRFYKTVTDGQLMDDVSAVTVVNAGMGTVCFSPGHIHGLRSTALDLTLTWRPRTRIPWTAIRGVPGPSGENEEHYQVQADTPSGPHVWTTTARTVTYTAAEQTADGVTPGTPVQVTVWQISAIAGLGHPGQAIV